MSTDKYMRTGGSLNDSVSGDISTAIFEIDYPEDSFELYGFASDSVDATKTYHDYVPNMFAPYYEGSTDDDEPVDDTDPGDSTDTGDTDTTEPGDTNTEGQTTTTPPPSGTPGFEFLALIAAFAAILFIVKKRT
ncbi:MAG: hypothetical protein KGY65_01240 [Candidatus Thermoplasmatota archaeon]|nr:hypothetical protein [Candidatus Thermoplasmatota archaeon]MBS3801354.1 hypothetical protein [Candidatus Thermoplasmatota archaeon]